MEMRWERSKARHIGDGYTLLYHGEGGRGYGVGVILNYYYYIGRVLEAKRVSDRLMYMKLDIEGV